MRTRVEQDRCLEAVLQVYEGRLQCCRSGVTFPENVNRSEPSVEMCATVGPHRLAFEHTLIQPAEGFEEAASHFGRLHDGFDELVRDHVPPSHAFMLSIPIFALNGLKAQDTSRIRRRLAEFCITEMRALVARMAKDDDRAEHPNFDLDDPSGIKAAAKWISARIVRTPETSITVRPDQVPFEVTLTISRRPLPNHVGTLQFVRSISGDLELQRISRVARALGKGMKLNPYGQTGHRRVLVLESNDIALTNDRLIFEALSQAWGEAGTVVDDVYLVDSTTPVYAVRQLASGGTAKWHDSLTEFRAADLAGLRPRNEDVSSEESRA